MTTIPATVAARRPAAPPAAVAAASVGTGIALMLAAQLLLMPANDAVVKLLAAAGVPAAQLAWARFFFNFLLLAPAAWWRHGRCALRPARPPLQILRGGLIVASNLLFIAGLRHVPLATATSIVLVSPLAVAALSPLVLRERVSPAGWAAVAAGFLGVLVIVRPGLSGLAAGPAALLPLGSGLCFAGYLLVTRKLAGASPPLVTQAATAGVGAMLTTLLLPVLGWRPPSPTQWALMVVIGAGSCAGHLLITAAHEHARAAALAPLTYLSLVSAAALGYLLFGDWPDPATWVGAAIVVASGLALWRRG